jgi:hypothetical protein
MTMNMFIRGVLAASFVIAACSGGIAAETTKSVPGAKVANKITGGIKTTTTGTVGPVTGTTGGTVSELTASDCRLLLGGQVIQVSDGRCGASGAYCKAPTVSACLTE